MTNTRFPTLGEALAINRRFTGLAVRDIGLLASALGRPQASAFGRDAYPDLWSKAAALVHSVIRNYPFMEANKRTSTVLALNLLRVNGTDVDDVDTEAMLSIAVAVANSDIDVDKIAVALRVAVERVEPFDPRWHLLA
ncbi:type II toxin-antitoxin system death-on-curing family toxin [Phytoactinopolyspora alkaliphila]|uniref:type II toxin-antitoxin system death-on-curing family toxin n=1 Tax=Phytoactinopolyspora alkaliphila TaxID=1783498 RepID=UPI001C205D8F